MVKQAGSGSTLETDQCLLHNRQSGPRSLPDEIGVYVRFSENDLSMDRAVKVWSGWAEDLQRLKIEECQNWGDRVSLSSLNSVLSGTAAPGSCSLFL